MSEVDAGVAGVELAESTQWLDGEKILAAMVADSRALVASVSVTLETASTQTDALGAPMPGRGCAIFLAERQTQGQGRRGRTWVSPLAANLYMSVSRRFNCELAALTGLSLVVGVAAAEALNATCGGSNIGVKWPNDLVADGKKLGGILIQLRADPITAVQAVIGIGINVRMPLADASGIDQDWCDLQQLGSAGISRNDLAAALLDALLPALDRFEQHGLAPFLPRWQQLDSLAGKAVRIIDGTTVHDGTSLGIDGAGALRVRLDGHDRLFHSGDVSLRPA